MNTNPIYLALDMYDAAKARRMVEEVRDYIGGLKIGLGFWYHNNRSLISNVMQGFDCFLDLKWKDIPMQVAGAMRGVLPLRPTFVSVHEDGGPAMLQATAEAARDEAQSLQVPRPHILAVTVLTSLRATLTDIVTRGHRAMMNGADGVICSPLEVPVLRDQLGVRPILMTPGIRMPGEPEDDHQRSATPREAMDAGADFLVIGRPITQATNPREAAKKILDSLG